MPAVPREMRPEDVDGVLAVCREALWGEDADGWWKRNRVEHLLASDPGGAWVVAEPDGVVGVAMALRREAIWGLSLLAVAERRQGAGLGRALLQAALGHWGDARGGLILSSERPAAMRLYAQAGFALRPCVSAFGPVSSRPAPPPAVRAAREDDRAWIDEVSRAVRGAAHSRDFAPWLGRGARLLCVPARAWAALLDGRVLCLAARDEQAAGWLLEAHLAAVPEGENAVVDFIAAGHDWALRACLAAGLALSPDGPIFTRGELGTLAPFLPNGAFL